MTSRQIRTVYSCKCQACQKSIAKGELVWYKKDYGCRCTSCGQHTEDSQPSKRGGRSAAKFQSRKPEPKPQSKPMPIPQSGGEQPKRQAVPFDRSSDAAVKCSDGVYRYEFKSVTECVQNAMNYGKAQNEHNQKWIDNQLDRTLSGHSEWGNYYTKEKFEHDLQNPPAHIVEAVEQLKEYITEEVSSVGYAPRRKVRRGCEFGEEIDADKFLCRNPNLWDRTVREMQEKKTVTIGCNLAIAGSRKAKELLYRGAAAVALAEVLGAKGYNVGITLFESRTSCTSSVSKFCSRVIVKEPNMSLDISSVSFAICEIAFFRACLANGAMRLADGEVYSSLGSPASLFEADAAEVDYYIDSNVFSKEQAVEWVKSCLKRTEAEVQNV